MITLGFLLLTKLIS